MNTEAEDQNELPWTGARYVPQINGKIRLEHLHRYLVAREYATDKDVLDIACGEGFGSAVLARSARSVVGVDIAKEVVKHAACHYQLDNVKFLQGSCTELPLDRHSIDLVVSFETIEHHDEHAAMMTEIKRVMRPNGLLIISIPDRKEYSILAGYRNPLHVRELFKEEFKNLIQEHFKYLTIVSQRIVYGSGIFPQIGTFQFADFNINDTDCSCPSLDCPRYLIAIASDETLPFLSGGLLEEPIEESEIVKGHEEENERQCKVNLQLSDEARQLQSQATQAADEIHRLQQQLQSEASHAADEFRRLQEQIKKVNLAFHEAKQKCQSISHSLSWRMTLPLRVIRDASAKAVSKIPRRDNSPRRRMQESSSAAFRIDPPGSGHQLDSRAAYLANLIRESALFDAETYDASAKARAQGFDPALHYVLVGEAQGIKPSAAFDPAYYGNRYPDIAACGINRLGHYLEAGEMEGRRSLPIAATLQLPITGINPTRRTVLILIHEASRTGAPILGWNIVRGLCPKVNVVAILMRAGQLEKSFTEAAHGVVGPLGGEILDPPEVSELGRRLAEIYRPIYVIANSVETRALVPALTEQNIPAIVLAHEFSGYTKPAGCLHQLFDRAAEIVFPADIVRRASEADYRFLSLRSTHVLAQGPSFVPRSQAPIEVSRRMEVERTIRSRLRPEGARDDLVVVGMGFVDWRKGVDLFIAAAKAILSLEPESPVRFIWVGDGYRDTNAVDVSCYLSEQVTRSCLGSRFMFMDAVEDVESIYQEADVLFLSSRLDPLPNVSIDATLRGIPVVCFAEASGIAEILASHQETRELVLAHLDVGAAAALIGSLAADRSRLRRLGAAVCQVARARFDLESYVAALDELGWRAAQSAEQMEADVALIYMAGAFEPPLYLGERAPGFELVAAVREYIALATKYDYKRLAVSYQACTRRPMAGFHPITYALQSPSYGARANADPLAHYLRSGRPEGPWAHPIIRIDGPEVPSQSIQNLESPKLRVVLHGHFHYTDHISEFLRAIAANDHQCELILTTTSTDKAADLRTTLREFGSEADIRVVPNRGRDIGPYLAVLEEVVGRCDLLGHIHGKRSPQLDKEFADRWRVFLWQHLIGDKMPMIDIIKKAFTDDETLGLVFPEDPFLIGWDKNLAIAQELAQRMQIRAPLPVSIESPIGMMFWSRPKALAPLLRLGLTSADYPNEPPPVDGTILHALERLLVSVAEDAGYHYATTYLPSFVR